MKKVSFDFDSTLDRPKIEEFAKSLVDQGFEVWIVTTRLGPEQAPSARWNDDLFATATRCGIDPEHIYFTNGADKWLFLQDKEFIFHIDDDSFELKQIQQKIKGTAAISSWYNPKWKVKCEKAIKKYLESNP
jgi:hypothetical protein